DVVVVQTILGRIGSDKLSPQTINSTAIGSNPEIAFTIFKDVSDVVAGKSVPLRINDEPPVFEMNQPPADSAYPKGPVSILVDRLQSRFGRQSVSLRVLRDGAVFDAE